MPLPPVTITLSESDDPRVLADWVSLWDWLFARAQRRVEADAERRANENPAPPTKD